MSSTDDIEDLHREAVRNGSNTYIDPRTGFMVFTELNHLRRGTCCGNGCRHCPYGWENLDNKSRPAKLKSGDMIMAQTLVRELQEQQNGHDTNEIGSTTVTTTNVTNGEQVAAKSTKPPPTTPPKQQAAFSKKEKTGGRRGGHLTNKNVPYTRGGDKGTSQLLTGERRAKDDAAFEAMGTVDELCSVVGVVHAHLMELQNNNNNNTARYEELNEWLMDIMSRLFDVGSHVAKPKRNDDDDFQADGVGGGFHASHVTLLEEWIDRLTDELPELGSFILPAGTPTAAQLHVARCVCRRAERRVVPLVDLGVCDPHALKYLNRLSDFFFSAARYVNYCEGMEEIQYRREYRGAKQRNRVSVALNNNNNN